MKGFAKEIVKHAIGCCAEAFASAAGGHLAERLFSREDNEETVVKEDDPASGD